MQLSSCAVDVAGAEPTATARLGEMAGVGGATRGSTEMSTAGGRMPERSADAALPERKGQMGLHSGTVGVTVPSGSGFCGSSLTLRPWVFLCGQGGWHFDFAAVGFSCVGGWAGAAANLASSTSSCA